MNGGLGAFEEQTRGTERAEEREGRENMMKRQKRASEREKEREMWRIRRRKEEVKGFRSKVIFSCLSMSPGSAAGFCGSRSSIAGHLLMPSISLSVRGQREQPLRRCTAETVQRKRKSSCRPTAGDGQQVYDVEAGVFISYIDNEAR